MKERKAAAYRQGIYVFVALALLTALEYWVSQAVGGRPTPLILIALVKAGLIVQYFMHIYRLWRAEDHS
jgi:cytochrome c oxidase subunit IV